jgi:hypothetical protein
MRPVIAARVVVILALTLISARAGAATPDQESYYLGTDGFPHASLVANPAGGELPNFDRGRDVEPGLFLERSALGLAETDDARYQHWQAPATAGRLVGYPTLVIWAAAARFSPDGSGVFDAFLLDCNGIGSDCSELGSGTAMVPSGSETWTEATITFDPIDHRFDSGRSLGVRVVVSDSSTSDLMFAYGYPAQRSRVTIYAHAPVAAAETTVMAMDAEANPEPMRRSIVETRAQAAAPAPDGSSWAWLVTVGLSALFLMVLGWVLVRSLTRPGRHEARFVSSHSGLPSPKETVSAR